MQLALTYLYAARRHLLSEGNGLKKEKYLLRRVVPARRSQDDCWCFDWTSKCRRTERNLWTESNTSIGRVSRKKFGMVGGEANSGVGRMSEECTD